MSDGKLIVLRLSVTLLKSFPMKNDQFGRIFHDLLGHFKYGMLVTYNPESGAHVRPMAVVEMEADCDVWLLTHEPSGKTEDIHFRREVCLSFQNDPLLYVVLYGSAEVVHDTEKIYRVWREEYRPWLPGGPEDPGVALIRVDAHRGEFWNYAPPGELSRAHERGLSHEEHHRVQLE